MSKKPPDQQGRSDESLRGRLKHQHYQIPADKQTSIHHTWQNTKGRSLIAVSLWAHKVCDTQSRNPAETQETRAAGVGKAQWAEQRSCCPWRSWDRCFIPGCFLILEQFPNWQHQYQQKQPSSAQSRLRARPLVELGHAHTEMPQVMLPCLQLLLQKGTGLPYISYLLTSTQMTQLW